MVGAGALILATGTDPRGSAFNVGTSDTGATIESAVRLRQFRRVIS